MKQEEREALKEELINKIKEKTDDVITILFVKTLFKEIISDFDNTPI